MKGVDQATWPASASPCDTATGMRPAKSDLWNAEVFCLFLVVA